MLKDIWLGVRNLKETRYFDQFEIQPFKREQVVQRAYADGNSYQEEDFYFELGSREGWEGPCVYLKAGDNFKAKETNKCFLSKTFVCAWNGK